MNTDRRATAQVCIALLMECSEHGEISQSSFNALKTVLLSMRNAEFWQLRNQEKYEGKNEPTDRQIRISRVALPALEEAEKALVRDEFDRVLELLQTALNADGEVATPSKKRRK